MPKNENKPENIFVPLQYNETLDAADSLKKTYLLERMNFIHLFVVVARVLLALGKTYKH